MTEIATTLTGINLAISANLSKDSSKLFAKFIDKLRR